MFSTIDIEQPGNEMRRIEIVLRELERLSQAVTLEDLARGSNAFTAEQIGFNLGLARNSVSKDLNQLWSDGLVIKTRPYADGKRTRAGNTRRSPAAATR